MALVDPLIGRQLGSFQIERLLGRGGMGKVYYGLDVHLQRPAAIKVIDERYRGDSTYAGRFVREARAMASWRHANIPQIYQAGQEAGLYYYAMEYIQGFDLARLLEQYSRQGELPPHPDVLRVGRAVAEALDYAHSKGAIHRDVKPSNILIAQDGRILLTDFGLVMQIAQGTMGEVFGSPSYMAPEQARSSAQAVPQSDLYSLGVILYEMLAGALPFEDPSPAALALKHLSQEPPSPRQFNPALSPAVESVLLKALHKQPTERYATGRELIEALETALAGGESPQATPSPPAGPPATVPVLPSSLERAGAAPHPDAVESGAWPTISQQSLHELVVSQFVDTLLPPGPTALHPEPARPQAASPPAPVNRLKWGIGCALLLALAALPLVFGVAWAISRLSQAARLAAASSPTAAAQTRGAATASGLSANLFATLTAISPVENLTAEPTSTSSPTPPEPTQTPEPTPTETVVLQVLLVMDKGRSLFLVNQSQAGLPLATLQIGSGEGQISGEEWGLDLLESGQCVSVLEGEEEDDDDNGDRQPKPPPKPPRGLKCEQVGERVVRGRGKKIWEREFGVYYQEALVGLCEGRDKTCTIRFPLSD